MKKMMMKKAAASAMAFLLAFNGLSGFAADTASANEKAGLQKTALQEEELQETGLREAVLPEEEEEQPLRLWYQSPADINTAGGAGGAWTQESLPLGNGDLGGLIFGGIEKDRIHFNQKTLWTGGPSPNRPGYQFGNKDTAYTAQQIDGYRRILDDKSKNVFNMGEYGIGAGSPIPFSGASNLNKGEYQDFGDIWLDFSPAGFSSSRAKDYYRDLNLRTGVATTRFSMDGIQYTREHFVSAPDKVMVTRLTASKGKSLSFDARMELNNGGLQGAKTMDEASNMYVIDGIVADNGLKFRASMQIIPTGGVVTADKGRKVYEVRDADEVMIVMSAETNYLNDYPVYRDNDKDLAAVVDQRVKQAGEMTCEELYQRHEGDYASLFGRVELDLGEPAPMAVPTNELMDQYRVGKYSTYLETLAFQYGRYLTIAGSRGELPSNLVGLWTVGGSAWTGDYHFNVNIEMNYWPVYVTNLAECGTTLVNYMESLREPGRLTAERVHGITDATVKHNGFTVHTENNPFGMTAPSNAQEYGWNPAGAAWAMQGVYDYYRFTGDEEYLKDTIYPIMKEAAMFWDNYLCESTYQKIEEEGSPLNGQSRLVVSPSVSAEQGPTAAGSTYDQSLVWELYRECIEAAEIVGETDMSLVNKWKHNIERLDPINVNSTDGIKEWYEETRVGQYNGHNHSFAQAGGLAEIPVPNSGFNIGHPGEQRHASNLVGLYPGTLINAENQEYMNAAIQSLNERGFYSTGWSKANKTNLWARTGQGNNALKTLRNLIGGRSSGLQYNLFDSHGSGGGDTMMNGSVVWQIDGNYGLTAGVAEMLLQSQLGYTQFLPALPDAWQNGEVSGLKARGNFTIGEAWQNGLAETFTVEYDGAEDFAEFTGNYKGITEAAVYADGKRAEVTKEADKIHFQAQKGVVYTIDIGNASIEQLKNKGQKLMGKLHPDLAAFKEELGGALESADTEAEQLNGLIRKGETVDGLYREFLKADDGIYCLTTDGGLAQTEIYEMYVSLMQIKRHVLENSQTLETYLQEEQSLKEIQNVLEGQLAASVVLFSKPSGMVDPQDHSLILSRHADAPEDYVIRYTADGTEPLKNSALYKTPVGLDTAKDTTIRAALFKREQRVSPVFSEKYTVNAVRVSGVTSNVTSDWGETYSLDKLNDGKTDTRWASKGPSGNVEITLQLDKKQKTDTLRFDQFVSSNNSTDLFEVQYYNGTEYLTAYEGSGLGGLDDKTGEMIQPDAGYHAVKTFRFPSVDTDRLKVVIKTYSGEPSFFEIVPFSMSDEVEQPQGDAFGLLKMTAGAKAAVERQDPFYENGDPLLKQAFTEAILDCEGAASEIQSRMDSREYMLRSLYNSLGLGETDRSALEKMIGRAQTEAGKTDYTKDSIYLLKKAIEKARQVMEDVDARQPSIDAQVKALNEKILGLVSKLVTKTVAPGDGTQRGDQWKRADTGYLYNTTPNGDELTYSFSGTGVSVTSVKAADHGNMKITIRGGADTAFEETIEADCYISAGRDDAAKIFDRQGLPNGGYTISFQHIGGGSGQTVYVEVGGLQVTQMTEEPALDRGGLEAALLDCGGLSQEDYTKGTFAALQKALEHARNVSGKEDEDTCNEEIKDVLGELLNARSNLIALDRRQAEKELQEAKAVVNENYTEDTWKKFQAAVSHVDALLQGDVTQQELDDAVKAMASARKALAKKPVKQADKTRLKAAYEIAVKTDFSKYTTASANAVQSLLGSVSGVLADQNALQSTVDGLYGQLSKAIKGLVKKEVKPVPVRPASIKFQVSKKTLGVKEKFRLTSRVKPSGAAAGKLTYQSSSKKVVKVSSKGVVQARKKGSAVITVRTSNGKKAKCRITVRQAPKKLTLTAKKRTLKVRKTLQLKARLNKGSAGKITYTSGKKKIATVDSRGRVKGLKKGKVTITAKAYNGVKTTIRLSVK